MKNILTAISLLFSITALAQSSDSAQFYYQKGLEEKNAKHYLAASKAFDKAINFGVNATIAQY